MSGTSSSGGGGGQHFTAGNPRQQHHRAPHSSGNNEYEQPVLSERDRKELMSLANENISMDFILEMKEAFQLFDKVTLFDLKLQFFKNWPKVITYGIFRELVSRFARNVE